MKSVLQAANEIKTEMLTSMMENSNGMRFLGETAKWNQKMTSGCKTTDEMKTEIVTSTKNKSVKENLSEMKFSVEYAN